MSAYDVCHAVGGMTAYNWAQDPKRLAFQYARYLVVAKLLEGKQKVLEVGCSDGQGARIVRQHVKSLTGVDVDWQAIVEARNLSSNRWPVSFEVHDITRSPKAGFDAVYCLDLIEHIENHEIFLRNLRRCAPICIIGTPSLESQQYASEISRREHINCVTSGELRERMEMFYRHVFVFGMNDTTVHFGFDAMRHYLFGLGIA